jgi:hypothetical protein
MGNEGKPPPMEVSFIVVNMSPFIFPSGEIEGDILSQGVEVTGDGV